MERPDLIDILRLLAKNSSTPTDVLERLATSHDRVVRHSVASHPGTPDATREGLSADPDEGVRRAVAESDVTPPPLLASMSADPSSVVRASVAAHWRTPRPAVAALASDLSWSVRRAVACRPERSADIVQTLVRDHKADLLVASAANEMLAPQFLVTLREHALKPVRDAANANPSLVAHRDVCCSAWAGAEHYEQIPAAPLTGVDI